MLATKSDMSHGQHQTLYVVVSIVIAVLGSWTALDLNRQARSRVRQHRPNLGWLAATALAMGLSIWSMHFVAMLGFDAGFPIRYDVLLTTGSLILAIGSTALAFLAIRTKHPSHGRVAVAGLFMGCGICLMHYVGMAAIRAPAHMSYNWWLVAASLLIAVVASWAALVAALRDDGLTLRAIGAVVLGFAICSMHYTAMAAASFEPLPHAVTGADIDRLALAFGIASSTMLLLFLALMSSMFDRRFELQSLRETRRAARSEAYLRTVLGELPVGVFVVNADTRRIEFANREAAYLAGAEVEGRSLPDPALLKGHHPDGRAFEHQDYPVVRTLMTGARVDRLPVRISRPDGSDFHAEASSVPVRDEHGRVSMVVLALADVTARVVAEESLRQAQKLGAIGQLTGGIAHDFNNLLTVIRSSADLLRRPDLPDEKRGRYVDAIAATADRAARLTSQLLAFARRQTLMPERFDVGSRLSAIQEMLRTIAGPRIAVRIEASDQNCFVEADPSQFETAIVNMVVNARDAMNGEGRLTIVVACTASVPAGSSHDARDGDYVRVAIGDTGTGIPADQLDRVFEPFFTTKPQGAGTGLGLSQVFGFAKQSGGEIQVMSRVGEGTTFSLYLPRTAPPAEAAQHSPLATGETDVRSTILVVEDNIQVGEFAVHLLEDLGHDVVWADSGTAALQMFKARPGAFDLVFTDVVMPGMSGIELAQQLRRIAPEIPVILTSGYSDALSRDGTQGLPLLQKPYSMDSLAQAIGLALKAPGSRAMSGDLIA